MPGKDASDHLAVAAEFGVGVRSIDLSSNIDTIVDVTQ
jgi:hypothetical protein